MTPRNADPTPLGEARTLLQEWLDNTDWDGASPDEGERANAVHTVLTELGCLERIVEQIDRAASGGTTGGDNGA